MIKKNDLNKAKNLYNIFRFIDNNLNPVSYGGKVDINYYDIFPKELELGKEMLTHVRLVFGFDIKIRYAKCQIGLFNKRGSFLLSIVKIPNSPRNVPLNILKVYFATGAESFRIVIYCYLCFTV